MLWGVSRVGKRDIITMIHNNRSSEMLQQMSVIHWELAADLAYMTAIIIVTMATRTEILFPFCTQYMPVVNSNLLFSLFIRVCSLIMCGVGGVFMRAHVTIL